jgi:hypothetical protein
LFGNGEGDTASKSVCLFGVPDMAWRSIRDAQILPFPVSIPTEILLATSPSGTARLRQNDRKSGKRIPHDKVVDGNRPVSAYEIGRGFEVGNQ